MDDQCTTGAVSGRGGGRHGIPSTLEKGIWKSSYENVLQVNVKFDVIGGNHFSLSLLVLRCSGGDTFIGLHFL